MQVYLTDGTLIGDGIRLDSDDLNRAVLQAASDRLGQLDGDAEAPGAQASLLHELCICELHFIAGQRIAPDGSHRLGPLLRSFEAYWAGRHDSQSA